MPHRKQPKAIEYNRACDPKDVHRYENVRWVENVSLGLRLVGFADEIVKSIRHTGWLTRDDEYDELYRGIVYQFPSHKGETRFVYGYADPNNDDCALLCFDTVANKELAARRADGFAEVFAEDARDYNRAWGAGRRYDDLGDEIKDLRSDALALCREIREQRWPRMNAPAICKTLREKVFSLYRQIQKARKTRKELFDSYGREPGFQE